MLFVKAEKVITPKKRIGKKSSGGPAERRQWRLHKHNPEERLPIKVP